MIHNAARRTANRSGIWRRPATIPVVLLLSLFCTTRPVLAQTPDGNVAGQVLSDDGTPLAGSTVRVEGTSRGAVTNAEGQFRIEGLAAGRYTLGVRNVGYAHRAYPVEIRSGETTTITARLRDSVSRSSVKVTGRRTGIEQNDTRTSVTRLDPRDAKYLPGAGEDVLRTLRALPGIVAPNDFTSQLVVRGSGPDQNLIVIDDIEVFNPYRLYGFVSMFNPETVSDITLMSGGFPARYGDRLSAVLDVTNRVGDEREPVQGKVNLSATNANAIIEGPLPGSLHGGWLLSARRTYYDLILGPIARSAKLVDGDVAFPNFRDLQAKASLALGAEHALILTGLLSRDGAEITSSAERERLDSIAVNDLSYNSLVGLAWRYTPSEYVVAKTTASWYENTGETSFGGEGGSGFLYGDVSRDSLAAMIRALPASLQDSLRALGITPENPPVFGIEDGGAGFTFRKFTVDHRTTIEAGTQRIELGAGIDAIRTDVAFRIKRDSLSQALLASRRSSVPDSIANAIDYTRVRAYAQDRISLGERVHLQPGLRFDYYGLLDRWYLAPRVSASFALDSATTLRGAWGIYYQSPGYEKLLDRQTFFDLSDRAVQDLQAERATHYVFGIEHNLTDEWQVRAEGYYKRFSDLIVQQSVAGTRYVSTPIEGGDRHRATGWSTPAATAADSLTSHPVNDASGEAYGVEFLLQKIGSRDDGFPLNGWIGYSLAWANRYRNGVVFPFNFDQRHTVNVVLNYKPNDWMEVGANFQYGSGFPYTPPLGFRPAVTFTTDSTDGRLPVVATNIFGEPLFTIDRGGTANINSARLPAYHRLDLRATFYAGWWGLDWAIYLDVINVYNHKNVLSRSSSVNKQTVEIETREVGMLPILPTLGIGVRF